MADRYFVEPRIADAARVELDGDEGQHLAKVMRAQVGDMVTLFDGSGDEFEGRVAAVRKGSVTLDIVRHETVNRELDREIVIAVALPKGDRQKWLIEKLVELGAARVIPLTTARGVAQPVEQALIRLRRQVIGSINGTTRANVDLGLTRVLGQWVEFVFRVRMNNPGASDGILQIWTKSQGASNYVQRVDLSNINYRENTTFSPNRLIQSNYQPDGTPSGTRYWDAWLLQQDPIDVSSGSTGVVTTSWANFNLGTNPINGVDFSAQDYPIWTPNNATYHTYVAGGAWDGSPAVRIRGSQVEQTACGLGNWVNLWRNGTVAIRKLNLRMQLRFGPTMVQNWSGQDWKFIIVQTNPTLTSETDPGGGERPMLHFNWASEVNGSGSGPAKLGMSAASGTVGNFVRTPPFSPSYGSSPNSDWFMGASAATYNGKPVIGPLEWVNLEMECISESTADAPNGRIRYVVTRRNGQSFDLSIPWNFDSAWTVGDYIHNVQLIGGYWNQAVNASDSGTYYELANIVFARGQTGLLGPPTGFVTG